MCFRTPCITRGILRAVSVRFLKSFYPQVTWECNIYHLIEKGGVNILGRLSAKLMSKMLVGFFFYFLKVLREELLKVKHM